jgi:hypothetical protein
VGSPQSPSAFRRLKRALEKASVPQQNVPKVLERFEDSWIMRILLKIIAIAVSSLVILDIVSFFIHRDDNRLKLPDGRIICFHKTFPGATDRYAFFVPYDCKDDKKAPLGEGIGADWGTIKLRTAGENQAKEIIIESDISLFSAPCGHPVRDVYKVKVAPRLGFLRIEHQDFPDPCDKPT